MSTTSEDRLRETSLRLVQEEAEAEEEEKAEMFATSARSQGILQENARTEIQVLAQRATAEEEAVQAVEAMTEVRRHALTASSKATCPETVPSLEEKEMVVMLTRGRDETTEVPIQESKARSRLGRLTTRTMLSQDGTQIISSLQAATAGSATTTRLTKADGAQTKANRTTSRLRAAGD